MGTAVRDLEHRFDISGLVFVAQVCSPDSHSAAPVSAGAFDVQIVTSAADELSAFYNDDPEALARRVVVDVSRRMPIAHASQMAAFYDKVVEWIREHRRTPYGRSRAE